MELHSLIKKEGKYFSALCLEFDVASQGKTLAEAQRNIKEAVELYLDGVSRCKGNDKKRFLTRRAPYKYWKEYYDIYYKQAPKQIIESISKSHQKITFEPAYA